MPMEVLWRVGVWSTGVSLFLDYFGGEVMSWIGDPTYLQLWETATRYQLFHSVGIILASGPLGTRAAPVAGGLMGAGILLFSGTLYLHVLSDKRIKPLFLLPVGILFFAAGWTALALRR